MKQVTWDTQAPHIFLVILHMTTYFQTRLLGSGKWTPCLSNTWQVAGFRKNTHSPHTEAVCQSTDKYVRILKLYNMQLKEFYSCCFLLLISVKQEEL